MLKKIIFIAILVGLVVIGWRSYRAYVTKAKRAEVYIWLQTFRRAVRNNLDRVFSEYPRNPRDWSPWSPGSDAPEKRPWDMGTAWDELDPWLPDAVYHQYSILADRSQSARFIVALDDLDKDGEVTIHLVRLDGNDNTIHEYELMDLMHRIEEAQKRYQKEHGKYLECPENPSQWQPGLGAIRPMFWEKGTPFAEIGFDPEMPVFHCFSVKVSEDGEHFTIKALGDLDEDGNQKFHMLNSNGKIEKRGDRHWTVRE